MNDRLETGLDAAEHAAPEFQNALRRFVDYADSFRDEAGALPLPMHLKLLHTFEVCRYVQRICDGEGCFDARTRMIFATAGLFHDASRFEQYQKHKTFLDCVSFDHGDRSAELLSEHDFLKGYRESEIACVTEAVRVHNKLAIPDDFPPAFLPAARMTRDADKIAILLLLIRFFSGACDDPTVRLDLPDTPELHEDVLAQARIGSARYADLKNVNDFKIAIFGWAHDLNYASSRRIVLELDVYGTIRNLLPSDVRVDDLLRATREALTRKGMQ